MKQDLTGEIKDVLYLSHGKNSCMRAFDTSFRNQSDTFDPTQILNTQRQDHSLGTLKKTMVGLCQTILLFNLSFFKPVVFVCI